MATNNHLAQTDSIKETNILDNTTTKDSQQSSQDVETKNSDSIKQNINEIDHLQYKLTDENKTETTNVQVPIVDEVNSKNDKNEEHMDTNNFDADFNESKQIHNEAQQVEVSSQSEPQDMEDEEYDMTDVADNDKIILNKYNQVEEDELLESHNEGDNNLAFNENSKTSTDVISIEQEEALLKSDDEDVEMSKYNTQTNSKKLRCEELKSNDNLNVEKYDAVKSNENFPNQNKSNLDSLGIDNNDNESHTEVEKYQQEVGNITTQICDVGNERSKKDVNIISQQKLRNNTENHRILYQFDLDDSSQESFQYEKSPRNQSNEGENESVKNLSQNYEKISHHDLPETCDIKDKNSEKKIEKEESDIRTEHHFQSDCTNSDDGNDVPSPPSKSHNKKGIESDGEESKEINVARLQCSKIDSPKSERSSSNEDQYNNDDVNEAKESSSKLSDLTTDILHTINENVYCSEEQNTNLIQDNSLSSNDIISNACSQEDRNEEDNTSLLKINGDRDTKNEYSVRKHIENSNDSYFKNDESTRVMKSRRTSLDTNITYTLNQQHSSFNLPQKEDSQSSFHNKIEEANSLALHTSDTTNCHDQIDGIENENDLKINENSREFEGHDNDMASKSSLLLSQSYTNPHEEEASRSSLASSASYSSSTSSSQHLVIDHPMDDVKEEKIKPLKISLKRKYSHVSDDGESTGPQPKQVHLYEEIGNQTETNEEVTEEQQEIKRFNEFCNNDENMDTSEIADKNDQIDKTPEVETVVALKNIKEQSSFLSNGSDLPSSPLKSLLLQQLEKPLALPNVAINCTDISLFNANSVSYSPAEQTALLAPQPVTSTQPISRPVTPGTGVTKYLCFKCKTGSFDNFAALTEHQITCLASHNLFSMGQMATQTISQLVPAMRQSPINSLKTSISLSATKLPTLTEPNGTIAPRNQPAVPSTKKRYYKCSTCNTFHENWNLFLHIREQHNRHMCLYCLRFFPSAEKLALHLEIKHDLEQNHFNSEEALRSNIPVMEGYALESRFLMCCSCQHIFRENEQFSQHDCSEFIKPCSLCGQKGRHTDQCKANPDSKRFSKLKKKKEKLTQLSERLLPPPPPPPLPHYSHERNRNDFNVSPITSSKHNVNPTINSNSNLNCDSGQAEKIQQPPTFSSIHNEDSNSSSNMVIDESYNISHIPPAQIKQQENLNQPTNTSFGIQTKMSDTLLEPDLPPNQQLEEGKIVAPFQPVKLVVPKFKLRVPKEFQKSVDDALSTSDSDDEEVEDDQDEEESHKKVIKNETEISDETTATKICITKECAAESSKNLLLPESTLGNSQDAELERTSATETGTEAGNSQDNVVVESGESKSAVLMDDDDSLDEPNSNLVRIMQEIERTKLDIQRTKKTSNRHNKPFALPRQPTVSQSSIRTTDRNWSPTPPASPNSRWFTPRRSTLSQSGEEQLQKTPQPQLGFLPPPKQLETSQERRDTIGSDMMDIDETITSQPTQTIICNKLRPLLSENFNEISENIKEQSCKESMETNQIANVEASVSILNNNIVLQSECKEISSLSIEPQQDHVKDENKSEIEDIEPKENLLETPENVDINVTKSTNTENTEQIEEKEAEDEANTEIDVCGNKEQEEDIQVTDNEKTVEVEKIHPIDGIEVANEDTVTVDMKLDKPLDKYEIVDFVRICLKTVYPLCLYCNHARRIAVNGKSLVLHMIGNHRFTASVDSITAEELLPATIVTKLKSFLPELEEHFFNSTSYCTYGSGAFTHQLNERIFECFQCRFVTSTHKELYLHNRKMHLRTAILCFMCRANFFSFSEILCHICPGVPNKVSVFDVKFRCCLCDLDNIPSPFRLMVHLRKKHFACDVCLEDCRDQSKLSSHVWKHKLHHLCYRCGIAYRNKLDITKHLFWKHGTESTICKKCLQKKWRHVYHFCIPPTTFVCEVCNLCFSKAMYLRVHKRLHSGDLRYPCIEDNCEEKFISRKLLLKHALVHQVPASNALSEKENYLQNSENKENEFGMTEDTSQEKGEINVKLELMEIKKEPLDESEVDSQKLVKEAADELSKKTGNTEEKIKISGTTDSKNDDVKDKNKHSSSSEPRKKRKKSKRSKELLEDLNLTAPNLSESDSSDDSDSDSDSKTKSEIDALPRVNLSPPSETENEEKENKSTELVEPGQVLEIWKNFLKTQQGSSTVEELERLKATKEENKEPKRKPVHVACSDHDYCKIEPDPLPPPPPPAPESESKVEAAKDDFKIPSTELTTPGTSPTKRKQSKSPRQLSSRRSDASSSSSGSSSSSDSSCSCGSNCSCSSSDSNSSSSSSSSEDSDSSLASNNSLRKRHRKKSERDRLRKRSESMSPIKQHKLSVSISEVINVDDEATENVTERPISPPKEPLFYESDLETNESETDEEFYDEHPQKLANELLAAKRAQLIAQTRLSPSHNYDIVENSRPSTPSLPEEVTANEKPKVKVKKKKRDRKSSCKAQGLHTNHIAASEQRIQPAEAVSEAYQPSISVVQRSSSPTTTLINSVINSHHTQQAHLYTMPQNNIPQTIYALPPPALLTEQSTLTPRPLTMAPYGNSHRMSEGSSCSDADGSLKRSKRQRRPNKFYGYTSDDENLINGPPLMIGSRAFKPQPPPQLTWRKEDLPTPSKSIFNNKNKTPRTPKTPAFTGNTFTTAMSSSSSKKKSKTSIIGEEKSARKKTSKKKDAKAENKFPPIPTLKIRPSEIGLSTSITNSYTKSGNYNTTDDTSSDDDDTMLKGHSNFNSYALNQPLTAAPPPIVLPSQPPAPPVPQTTAFNHRIPPALLPNPDFATLQYFKANNIRYPIRPPAGARQPREGESVYCYCRCPYDEVSEMIACDGENCLIEWFHFECVGIMVAPQGKWFCAECRPKYSEELYPSSVVGQLANV